MNIPNEIPIQLIFGLETDIQPEGKIVGNAVEA